jgi:hypothetical protein
MNLIAEAKAEQVANPISAEDMLKESNRLARYGAAQARKLGRAFGPAPNRRLLGSPDAIGNAASCPDAALDRERAGEVRDVLPGLRGPELRRPTLL